ncbi:MAG: antibiotic biosynthesis monooxygenase [Cytophagaceae bacterium]|nr:antibiotic biosynthesis monooxygenase [Cytophagaceae bacterium]
MNKPYYAVIFTSLQTDNVTGYGDMAARMEKLAQQQPGYMGMEHARSGMGITISYWRDLQGIKAWKQHTEHAMAQQLGKEQWYRYYKVRICLVEREYEFGQI